MSKLHPTGSTSLSHDRRKQLSLSTNQYLASGNRLPAYVSQDGALPPGTEILIPKNICRVWWQDDLKKSSMFRDRNAQVHIDEAGEYISDACTLELDTASSKEISYDSTGLWRGIALRPSKAFQSGGMIASKPDTNAVDTCFRTIT